MPLDIERELQNTFSEAVMTHASKSLKSGEDWEQARAIIERGEKDRADLEQRYRDEYDTRVESVRERLNHEAGQIKHDHPTPHGHDKFDGNAINRQAHREVQHNHENDIQRSRDTQTNSLLSLEGSARSRDHYQGKARDNFAKVNDRRQMPDRRAPTRSR